MTLQERYHQAIQDHAMVHDAKQQQLLSALQVMCDELHAYKKPWFGWKKKVIKGAYIYGSVGAGKTFLMDLVYEALETVPKMRFHLHQFMQQIDDQLRLRQGQKDPLKQIAQAMARDTRVLCFDEFVVNDVLHAMLLATLLPLLVSQGVVMMVTSNTVPDELYANGLQRRRFLPVITLIQTHCQVLNLNNHKDYRLGHALRSDSYIYAAGDEAQHQLQYHFDRWAPRGAEGNVLNVQHRDIPCIAYADRTVWFDFNVICNLPRSQLDYLEIAHRFDTVLVSGVRQLGELETERAILLMHFVDVMYDEGVELIISAGVSVESIYPRGELIQVFQRTTSRLQEMQATDYLERHPRRAAQYLKPLEDGCPSS